MLYIFKVKIITINIYMDYRVVSFYSLTDKEKQQFYNFCKQQSTEISQPAAINMWHDDWKAHSNTLPYILEIESRFRNPLGDFNILKLGRKIVACAGVYQSEFSKDIAIAGCRTWVSKEFRNSNLMREFILPTQKKWSIENNFKMLCLSFNEYNKNIIEVYKRRRLGETIDRMNTKEQRHLFFTGLHIVDFPVTIQYTKQWVIYEKLDPSYNFDWSSIR
jgi:hypothetical protein